MKASASQKYNEFNHVSMSIAVHNPLTLLNLERSVLLHIVVLVELHVFFQVARMDE